MGSLSIAIIQLEVALGDPEANVKRARALLSQVQRGQNVLPLALLPELWTSGYDLDNASSHSFPLTGGVEDPLAQLAREANVFLCGSTLESSNNHLYNAQTLYSPKGHLVGKYRKIHLFGLLDEPQFLTAGEKPLVCDMPWGKTGFAICYDLRFPELFRVMALAGAGLILISAEWPHPRLEHWRTLLRARAIKNQAFVVACNAVGEAKGNVFFGHSMIINPWGEVLAESGEAETILFAELDLDQVDQIRSQIPVLKDRRAGLYE